MLTQGTAKPPAFNTSLGEMDWAFPEVEEEVPKEVDAMFADFA
jgi:hypothetical protein